MAKPSGIDGFVSITDTISFCRPPTPVTINSQQAKADKACLIVICSWMAAAPKHIAKYTQQYQSLFPDSSILLIQSTMSSVIAGDDKMALLLQPAVNFILEHALTDPHTGPIVLHCFSNGGGIIATHLALAFRKARGANNNLWSRIIFECLPSLPNIEQGVDAVSYSLPPNPIFRFVGRWVVRLWAYIGLLVCFVMRREDVITRERRRLNSNSTNKNDRFPKETGLWDVAVPRLYLYSKGDAVVSAADIHLHVEEARAAGFETVREEIFETAPHCGLPREDPKRYWDLVMGWISGTA